MWNSRSGVKNMEDITIKRKPFLLISYILLVMLFSAPYIVRWCNPQYPFPIPWWVGLMWDMPTIPFLVSILCLSMTLHVDLYNIAVPPLSIAYSAAIFWPLLFFYIKPHALSSQSSRIKVLCYFLLLTITIYLSARVIRFV